MTTDEHGRNLTPDVERIVRAAAEVANRAPETQGQYVHAAKIPWRTIHELRDALDALDVTWR